MYRNGFDVLVCVGLVCLIGTFVWHALHGERSFGQAEALTRRVEAIRAERDLIRAERMALDERVALLRPESVDPDLVEELARRRLGFVRENDLLIHLDR